jgi:hypothetical protein
MVRVHCSKETLDAHAQPSPRRQIDHSCAITALDQGLDQAAPLAAGPPLSVSSLAGEQAGHGRVKICLQKNWKAEAELTKGNVLPSNGCENGTAFTQECDTVYNGINKSDMNKEHSLEMIKQVDAFLATNPDPGIVALGKEGNVQQAIKLLPTAKFEVKKPSRAVHICWMENAREIWYTQARRSLIWKHFVFNGKVKLPGVGYVKFKEREQYRERIFGKKAKKGGKRKRKEASDKVDQDLIDFLIGSYMTSGESKHELADREEAITGINPLSHPDRQLETAADLLPDGHEDVQCDSDCD